MSDAEIPVVTASETPESPDNGSEAVESLVTEAPSVDPYESYGGKEKVEAAIRMHQATQTDEGVVQLFFEAGRSLGLGVKEIEALFAGQTPESEDPEELDRPLTVKEFREAQARVQQEQLNQSKQGATNAARAAVQETITALGVTPGSPDEQIILRMGDKYLKPADSLNPQAVAEAVKRGHADYQALIEKNAQEYLNKKVAKGQSVPSAPAGAGAPAAPPPEEPKNVMEAIRMARKNMGA